MATMESSRQPHPETELQKSCDEATIDLIVNTDFTINHICGPSFRKLQKGLNPEVAFMSRELIMQKICNRYDKSKDEFSSLMGKINQQVKLEDGRIYKEQGDNYFKDEKYSLAVKQYKKLNFFVLNAQKKESVKQLLQQMETLAGPLEKMKEELNSNPEDMDMMEPMFRKCQCEYCTDYE